MTKPRETFQSRTTHHQGSSPPSRAFRSRALQPHHWILILCLVGATASALPVEGALRPGVCDDDTVTTFVGLDTRSGHALFHLSDPGGERPPALLEVPSEGNLAAYHRPGRRVFGGSVGPGPVLAFERCGEACLKVFRWRDWAWTPLGSSLEIPAVTTVHATYDRSGAAWVVLLGETATRGRQRAWAYRWAPGPQGGSERWSRHGPLTVDAVGEPSAVPDPTRPDAILVGSGRFVPDGLARSWLSSLPSLPREHLAEVFPLATSSSEARSADVKQAVVLTADGDAFLTRDGGTSWERAGWIPPAGDGPEIWLDRPTGDRTGSLGAVWVDAKAPLPQLVLTEAPGEGLRTSGQSRDWGWKEVARLPSQIQVGGSTRAFEHYLRPDGRSWWLLTSCFDTPETSGLVVRGPRDLDKPRFLSIADP